MRVLVKRNTVTQLLAGTVIELPDDVAARLVVSQAQIYGEAPALEAPPAPAPRRKRKLETAIKRPGVTNGD